MYRSAKQGLYRIVNLHKFIKPLDEHMNSYKDGHCVYKSSLELSALKYCDGNPKIIKWSLEPFPIHYIKPSTGKKHRYYIDFFIEFQNNEQFLVEIKSHSETIQPKEPKKKTKKSIYNYQRKVVNYLINKAKWQAAEQFCKENGFKFIILTEKQLQNL